MDDIILNNTNNTKITYIIPKSIFDTYVQQIIHFPELCENEKFIDNFIKLVKLQNELFSEYNKEANT